MSACHDLCARIVIQASGSSATRNDRAVSIVISTVLLAVLSSYCVLWSYSTITAIAKFDKTFILEFHMCVFSIKRPFQLMNQNLQYLILVFLNIPRFQYQRTIASALSHVGVSPYTSELGKV